jgi:dihydroneopterin aldolase
MTTKLVEAAETFGTPIELASVRPSLRQIRVKNLVLPCHIGVHAHEYGRTQRVRISLELAVREAIADIGDDLRNVVCYDEIISAVRRLATAGHVRLLETLAERIAALCLNDPLIRTVRVELEKLDVYEDVEAVGVAIVRHNRQT